MNTIGILLRDVAVHNQCKTAFILCVIFLWRWHVEYNNAFIVNSTELQKKNCTIVVVEMYTFRVHTVEILSYFS